MGYGAYLKDLLRPLGVYDLREGTINRGELAAYGRALDGAGEEIRQARAKAQQAVGQEIVEQNACPVDGDPMAHDVVQASVGEPGEKPPARTVPRGEEHQRQYGDGDGPAVGQAVEPEHPQDDRQRHHDAALAEGSRAFLGQFVHVHCVLPP